MLCPKCQFQNRDEAKFCNECGFRFVVVCPECKTTHKPGSKFCDECGYKLTKTSTSSHLKTATKPDIPDQERKHVTVMFSDLSGYTAMSEKLDPEEVKDIMGTIFGGIAKVVVKYEGFIEKFIGDAVMALFGVPTAHEEDPVRAIKAAQEIHDVVASFSSPYTQRIGTSLCMHTGICTGLVVTGEVNLEKGTHGVLGDTINAASRISSLAQPDEILVEHETYRQAQGYFDFGPMIEVSIKGRKKPVKTFRVLRPRRVITRIEAITGKGLSPFVGRNKELDLLKDCLEHISEGHGQVTGIIGEPGAGKSRLVRQFKETLPAERYTLIEGGCINFGDAIPYLPILDMLKDYFDIKEDEDEADIRQKISNKVTRLSSLLVPILIPLCEVLSLKVDDTEYINLDAKQRREKVFEAIRLLLIAQSQEKPLIVIIEDLHWIDNTSEEFLSYLINSLATARILLILLYRPEYTPSWVGKTYYNQIRVDQLIRKTIEDLVKGILEGKEVESDLIDFISKKTEGNPLFIEEMTSSLLENGFIRKDGNRLSLSLKSSDIKVPATVQGIIAARLDRLEGSLKGIMQTASVIGREFAFRILQTVAALKDDLKTSLVILQDLELIYEKSIFPEIEYIFKHALTQEVAYNSLLIKKRRETHKNVGQAIEYIYENRLEEFYEMLAYHYSLSNDTLKAYEYLKLSAVKAVRNSANWEAVRFYKEALRMLDTRPNDKALKREKVDLLLEFQVPLFMLSYPQDSIEILQLGESVAKELGDQSAVVQFQRGLSLCHSFRADLSMAVRYAEQCFREAELREDIDLMVQSADQQCFAYFILGDSLRAADVSQRTLDLFKKHGLDKSKTTGGLNVYSLLSAWLGYSLAQLGRLEEARTILVKGIQNAHEYDDYFDIGMGMMGLSTVCLYEGDGDGLISHARENIKYYEKGGIAISLGFGWSFLGFGYFLQGDLTTAREYAEKGLSMLKEFRTNHFVAYGGWFLSLILLGMGELALARKQCEEALNLAQTIQARHIEGLSFMQLGAITGKEDLSRIEEAHGTIQKGISILEELKAIPSFSFGYIFQGEILAEAGRKEEARIRLEKAQTLYWEMGIKEESYWFKRTRESLAKL